MCVFCDIVNNKIGANIVYKDENVMAFLDNDPINEGHILLIFPRYENDGFGWNSSDMEYRHSEDVANKIRNAK